MINADHEFWPSVIKAKELEATLVSFIFNLVHFSTVYYNDCLRGMEKDPNREREFQREFDTVKLLFEDGNESKFGHGFFYIQYRGFISSFSFYQGGKIIYEMKRKAKGK